MTVILILLYVIFLLIIEFAAQAGSIFFAVLASRIWLITGIAIALTTLFYALKNLYSDIKHKNIIFLLGSLLITLLLLWPVIDASRSVIGQDATQQLAAGLDAFETKNWNYTGKAFLRYPARQYLLAALPAKLFGRTQLALKVGFAWPFWTGLMIFACSIRDHIRQYGENRRNDLWVLTAVTALFTFPYITEYYIYFEHTLLPVSFSLQVIGWLLYFVKKPTVLNSIALIWCGSMLIYSYTTALASALLLVVVLAFCFLSKTKTGSVAKISGLAVLAIAGQLVISFIFGRGDRVTELASDNISELLKAAFTGLWIGLLNDPAVFSSLYLVLIWVYLGVSLTFVLGRSHFLISLWTLSIFILSQVLKGYAVYAAQISFSRTMITVPVLITAFFILGTDILSGESIFKGIKSGMQDRLKSFIKERSKVITVLLSVLTVANISVGVYSFYKPVVQADAAKYFYPGHLAGMHMLMKHVCESVSEEGFKSGDEFRIVLYTDNVWFGNPKDYMRYFYPKADIYVLKSGEHLPFGPDRTMPVMIFAADGTPPEELIGGCEFVR